MQRKKRRELVRTKFGVMSFEEAMMSARCGNIILIGGM